MLEKVFKAKRNYIINPFKNYRPTARLQGTLDGYTSHYSVACMQLVPDGNCNWFCGKSESTGDNGPL